RGGVAQPAGGRLLVQADLRPVDREPRAEALVEGVEVPLDPFEDLRVGPGADAAQVLEEVAMARPSRGRQVGLRFEPDERDLGVSPVAGRVRERLEPLGELAADALGEEIPVGPQSAPQAPQADPEVVESLGVLGIVEPEPGGLGLVEETERQAARSLFGLAIQPADGSRAHPSPSSRKQAGGNAQIRSPVPASILPAKETIAAPPLRKRWKGREAPTRRARRAPRSGSWPTRAIGFPRSILEPEELCRASQRTSRSSGAPGASSSISTTESPPYALSRIAPVCAERASRLVASRAISGTSTRRPRAPRFILRRPSSVRGRSSSSWPVRANSSRSWAMAWRIRRSCMGRSLAVSGSRVSSPF